MYLSLSIYIYIGPMVGVVFSGRQAPGCHDLVCGVVDIRTALDALVPEHGFDEIIY